MVGHLIYTYILMQDLQGIYDSESMPWTTDLETSFRQVSESKLRYICVTIDHKMNHTAEICAFIQNAVE